MAKKEDRFIAIHKEGSDLAGFGTCTIIVDKVTGVTYLTWKSGYGAGITPLLGPDGKPIVYKGNL